MDTLQDLFGLQGQVAVITGASGGLGAEFAETLAASGANVVLMARRAERVEAAATELSGRFGVRALGIGVDITDREAVAAAFERVASEMGRLDILVNNAGVAPTGRAKKQWRESWDDTVELNLSALFHCSVLAAEQMRAAGNGGRIINLSSIFGHNGSPMLRVSAYAATKGAVENLTRQLAVEWAGEGITVNAIAPAWFRSEMTAGSVSNPDILERMASGCPMKRIGNPGELSSALLFLAAPASSYVTGVILPVDGGYSAW